MELIVVVGWVFTVQMIVGAERTDAHKWIRWFLIRKCGGFGKV